MENQDISDKGITTKKVLYRVGGALLIILKGVGLFLNIFLVMGVIIINMVGSLVR